MDPFEVRMQFITLLKRLSASQQSIQKMVSFSVKYFPQCGEDLWDCIIEECEKGSINSRINILYFLDSLCELCLQLKSHANSLLVTIPTSSSSSTSTTREGDLNRARANSNGLYVEYLIRDLGKIVYCVVPEGRQGLPNLVSTKQILESWRTKRVIDPQKIEEILSSLNSRTTATATAAAATTDIEPAQKSSTKEESQISRNEVFKRIEEDRERHKRLRERRWVQAMTHTTTDYRTLPLACFMPLSEPDGSSGETELAIDIEFENEWETTSDWNEDDDEAAGEETALCFPPPRPDLEDTGTGSSPMDLS